MENTKGREANCRGLARAKLIATQHKTPLTGSPVLFMGILWGKQSIDTMQKVTRMKMQQNNKLKMGQATLGCLQDDNNAPLWKGIAGLEEGVASLEATVDSILERSQQQSARTGSAEEKKAARNAMLEAAWAVCCGLKSLASKTDDSKLAAQVDFSRSDLAAGREADMVNRCKSILALGKENATALAAKYNVTASDLTALGTAITEFGGAQPKPRLNRAAKAAATADLTELFDDLDKVLNEQLDPLIEKFRHTNAPFYNEYQTARAIVDSAATHDAKPENSVALPASSPEPLPKAA